MSAPDRPRGAATDAGDDLSERSAPAHWLELFEDWIETARSAPLPEPTAMVLATADGEGSPSARTVLLKGVTDQGFVFFSNRESRKGRQIAVNPRAALVFPWHALQRQVLVTGAVELLDDAASDEYFATRPYGSQIGARASRQSTVIESREMLESARDAAEQAHPEGGPVPRPPYWGGFRIVPETVEFWHGRRDRLHDRLRYRLDGGHWALERLSP